MVTSTTPPTDTRRGDAHAASPDEESPTAGVTRTGPAEQIVRAQGTLFWVTDLRGDVASPGARELGLFFQDTRYLSHYRLEIFGAQVVNLSADTYNEDVSQIDQMIVGVESHDGLDDPQHYVHIRRRQLLDREEFVERVELTNFLREHIVLDVRFHFGADFADIFEVRGMRRASRGVLQPPLVGDADVELTYDGLDHSRYTTLVQFDPRPDTLTPHEARYKIALEAGATTTLLVNIRPSRDTTVRLPKIDTFAVRAARLSDEINAFREHSARFRCDSSVIEAMLNRSVGDLHTLRLQVGENRIVGAGIPWFCCPFGRDSLLTSYEALLLNPELGADSLRTLAAYQGRRYVDETEEEPGKILHELRVGEMARTHEIPHRPYYGSIDATPLFVIVADAVHRMTADDVLLRELRPAIRAALAWLDARSANGTEFVTYQRKSQGGIDNQGWKDSRSGVSFPDGTVLPPPIALCEVQGYCVDAYARGARLLRALGEPDAAATYSGRSAALCARVESEFWLAREKRYAFAIDGKGRTCSTVVSNVGHLLWSRVATPEHALSTANLLTAPETFSGYGIRTLAKGQPVYNPLSYHNGTVWPHDNAIIAKGMANYHLTEHAVRVFEGMVAAMAHFPDDRLPELFCGFSRSEGAVVDYPVACRPQAWSAAAPFLFLQAILGIHADAPAAKLSIRHARLPPSVNVVEIHGLRIGQSRVSISFRRYGRHCHVERLDVTGPALSTTIELD